MPIKPENRKRYPKNWKEIRAAVLERASHACEGSEQHPNCRVENYSTHPETGSKVVLTIAHLDHIPENCDGMDSGGPALPVEDANLRAMCQRCHLKYDAQHHAETARETRRAKLATSDMFGERLEAGAV